MNVDTGQIVELLDGQNIRELLDRGIVPIPASLQSEATRLAETGQRRVDLQKPSPLSTWAMQQRQRLANIKGTRRARRKRTRQHHRRLRARKR